MNINDIINNLNVVSEKLFKSIEGEVYTTLDKILNISSNLLKDEPLNSIFKDNDINGFIMIANSIILFFICYYILSQLISVYNGNKAESIYIFVIKIIIVTVLINNSYFICDNILNINYEISSAIGDYAKDICKQDVNFSNLKEKIISIKDFMKNDFLSLDGLIKGVISFGIITVLINLSIRYVTVIFFVIISPLAIVTLISDISSGIFKTYIKLFVTTLITEWIIKIVILLPLVYKDVNSIMYKIILVGTIYIIYRINMFTKDLFAKVSTDGRNTNLFKG